MILYIFLFCIGTYIFKEIDGLKIIKEQIIHKKGKWDRLYNLVSTKHKSSIIITLISLQMLFESFYQSIIQYLDNSVIKIDKNKYIVRYVINGKIYKMLVIPNRGPCSIVDIRDGEDNIVSDEIIPYFGPNSDWHGNKYYPSFFHYKILVFELANGDQKTFHNAETIQLY
jgi:hypothetical protein